MKDMLAIGNDELKDAPTLGNTVKCWICGKDHEVEFGRVKNKSTGEWEHSELLAFYKCGGETYLCGINGKELRL